MKNIAKRYGVYVLISLFIAIYYELFREARNYFVLGAYYGLLDEDYTPKLFLKLLLFFAASLVVLLLLNRYKHIFIYIDKYRYFIGIGIILICTIFELSGSSIASFYEYTGYNYGTKEELYSQGVIWGFPRMIRTDEWATLTPLNFAQEYNDYGATTEILRGTTTDVTTFYANPSFSLATLFRPFLWGYLLLGSAKGLAFYWSSRMVCLFLVTYEFGKILMNNKKILSTALACLVTFSQTIQWWYATNGLVEMFIFGELAIVLLYYLLKNNVLWQKTLICLGLIECAGGYLLCYYPAQQVPLAYVFGAIALYVLIHNRKLIKGRDILLLIGSVIIFGGLIALVLYNSIDTIMATMNTVYPGKRVNLGGNSRLPELFTYIVSLFTPINDKMVLRDNVCEMSVFYSMFPTGLGLSIYTMIRNKKADLLYIFLIIVEVFFLLFCVVGLPPIIAKITFLSYSFNNRVASIIGFIDIVLLIRSLSEKRIKKNANDKPSIIIVKLIIAIAAGILMSYFLSVGGLKAPMIIWVPSTVLIIWIIYLVLRDTTDCKEQLAITLICVISLTGLCVNPVQKGIDNVTNNEITSEVREIVEDEPDAKWIVINPEHTPNNLPVTVGAKLINSVNTYPNMELWKKLDPTGQHENLYNRYAHVDFDVVDTETQFKEMHADNIKVDTNYNDLYKLGVNYILSHKELTAPNLDFIERAGMYYIYKVK